MTKATTYNFTAKKAELLELIKDANKALAENSEDVKEKLGTMVVLHEEYNKELVKAEFDKWLETDEPMVTALVQLTIDQLHLKCERKEDMPDVYSIGENNKEIVFDMEWFVAYAAENDKIVVRAENWQDGLKYFKRVCERYLIHKLETKQADLSDLDKSMLAKGKPSKTHLKKEGQAFIDKFIFKPCEKNEEENAYIFSGKDWEFIDSCMTGEGKGKTGIRRVQEKTLMRIVQRAMHRILTGKEYIVELSK